MLTNIEAALFDLDGVVVFTDRYHYLGWKKLADEMGWEFDEEINHQLRGIPRMASLQVMLDHNAVELPEDKKEELAARKNDYYRKLLQGINEQDLYPGALEFIRELRAAGLKTALCSSSKNAGMVLEKLGIEELFDTVVTGADIKKAKPDPEIFLLAAERLGIHPQSCVVFEDADSGVVAGLAANMRCIGVGTPDRLPHATQTMERYSEIDIEALIESGVKTRAGAP